MNPYFVNKVSVEIVEPIKLAITEDQEEITWQAAWDAFGGIEAIDPGTRGAADITVTNWGLVNGSQNGDVIVDGSANSVVYTPYPNEFGNDSFTIFAEDSSNLRGFLTFEITIDSANDQPVVERTDFNSSSNRINVFENQRYVLDFNASDQLDSPEESSSAQQIWEISGTDSKLFYIDDNGSLYFQNLPDREEPLDGDKDNFYEIEIVVSDHPSGSSDPFPIKIQVLNVNEPPVFTDNNLIKVPDPFLEHNGFFTRVDVPEDSFVVYDPNCSDRRK